MLIRKPSQTDVFARRHTPLRPWNAPPPPPRSERGVFEIPDAPGYEHHLVVSSAGIPGVEIRVHESFVGNRDIVAGLRKWLNEAEPMLKIIHGDGA